MNLLYDLPEKDRKAAENILQSAIEYCVPANLSLAGKLEEGWFAVGKTRWVYLKDGEPLDYAEIASGSDYKLSAMIGDGYLECVQNGRARIIVRLSMKHLARYAYIARVLNQKANNEPVRIYNNEDEYFCPKCGRPLPSATSDCPGCAHKSRVLLRLLHFAKGSERRLAVVAVLMLFSTAVSMIAPYLQKLLINSCLVPKGGQKPNVQLFFLCIGGLAGAAGLTTLISIINSRVMVRVSSRISADLRKTVFDKLQSLSIGFLTSQHAGDIINRITSDTNRIRSAIIDVCSSLVTQILTLIAVSVLLFAINWKMALIILIPAPLVGFLQYYFWVHVLHPLVHRQWRVYDRSNSFLHDVLNGIRVVKAFGQEQKEIGTFHMHSAHFRDATVRTETVYSTLSPVTNFIVQIGQYFILFLGCLMIMRNTFTLGDLQQFLAYATMIYGPLTWLMYIPRMLGDASVACDRVFTVIDEKPEIADRDRSAERSIRGNVEVSGVTFGYRSYEPVLSDINLDVKQGEMIGLVGHSGAGKSTLVNLISRFYDVNEGSVKIDGVDLRDISQQSLHSQIGVVLQEPFLFNGTILDNIRYAKPDATLEEVIAAAKTANAHDFIAKFPDGYDTYVAENGNNLSGGERQRISIARAVLVNPRILILDEATSALDTETEALIQEALGRLTKNRTTFAIAHRLATLRNADRLVVLEKGRIAEVGTHDELLRKHGIYYKLVMAQREMTKHPASA